MSTVKPSETALESSARGIFLSLLWGAVMLFVFGFWTRAKLDVAGQAKTYAFWIAGGVALALALWQMFTLWFQKAPPEQKTTTLLQQRRLLSFAMMAGGLGLIVTSIVLGIDKKTGSYGFNLDNFGESIGALIFGAIAVIGGYLLQSAPHNGVSGVHLLAGKQPILKLLTLILGVAAIGTFIYFAYYYFVPRTTNASLAELAALLFFSMLCLACFLWLNTGVMTETDIRMFVLVFGGSVGVILFVLAMGRAIVWRDDVFLGGLGAWQGERSYRFWVCAYLMFASLVLMFFSFNLARADIRTSKGMRLLMYGFDTLAQVLLLIGILASLNIVVSAMAPFTYDWTKSRGAYSLSDSTQKLISGLKEETHIISMVPQNSPAYKELRIMLDNAQSLSNRLKVEYVAPDTDPQKYEQLVKFFPKIKGAGAGGMGARGVLIVAGKMPEKEDHNVPYEFVHDRKIWEFKPGQQGREGNKLIFKGESEIFRELKFLRQDADQRKIYVLQGQDEPGMTKTDPTERQDFRQGFGAVGISLLVDKLKADRYDVFGLSFQDELVQKKPPANLVFAKEDSASKRKLVPKDCKTLIVAGVSKTMPSEVLEAIDHYVERGGKLMVFLDVIVTEDYAKLKDSGLEAFLKRFSVDVKNEYLLRLMDEPRDDPRLLWATAPPESTLPMVRQFGLSRSGIILLPRSARVVAPSAQPGGRFKAETILQLEPNPDWPSITEKNVKVLLEPQRFMIELMQNRPKLQQAVNQEPVSVGVAVRDGAGDKPCMVVFGDTEFITNRELAVSRSRGNNYNFTSWALEWLAEREDLSGTQPSVKDTFQLPPTAPTGRMILLPGWIMLLAIIALGITIWVVRRR